MVPAVNPVKLLVNIPIPEPSTVFVVNKIVGFAEVLQQTPLAVAFAPPLDVIFPPLVAELNVIDVASVVVKVGNTDNVEKLISFPKAVPELVVANALTK